MMSNNDVFRIFLHLTGMGKERELTEQVFLFGGIQATRSKIKGWRTSLDNPRASHMPDEVLQCFFDGVFIYRDMKLAEGISLFNFTDSQKPNSQ